MHEEQQGLTCEHVDDLRRQGDSLAAWSAAVEILQRQPLDGLLWQLDAADQSLGRDVTPESVQVWLRHFVGRWTQSTAGMDRPAPAPWLLWDAVRQARRSSQSAVAMQVQLAADELRILRAIGSDELQPAPSEAERDYAQHLACFLRGTFCLAQVALRMPAIGGAPAKIGELKGELITRPVQQAILAYAAYWGGQAIDWPSAAGLPQLPQFGRQLTGDDFGTVIESLFGSSHIDWQPWEDRNEAQALAVGWNMAEHGLRWLLELAPGADERLSTKIVFRDRQRSPGGNLQYRGRVETLALDFQRTDAPRNLCVAYPDPVALGIVGLGQQWRRGIDRATLSAREGCRDQFASCDRPLPPCSWRVEWLRHSLSSHPQFARPPLIYGDSASAAFATAMCCYRLRLIPDRGVAISASVDRDGRLQDVRDKADKVSFETNRGWAFRDPQSAAECDLDTRSIGRLLVCTAPELLQEIADQHQITVTEVSTVAQAVDWVGRRRQKIVEFLQSAGRKSLLRHLEFQPKELDENGVFDFCLPPRVMTMREWKQKLEERPSAEPLSLDELLDGDCRARPLRLGMIRRLTWLYGEPGEGKTTAVWWLFATACREAVERIDKYGLDDPEVRLPFAMQLQEFSADQLGQDDRFGDYRRTGWLVHQCLDHLAGTVWGSKEGDTDVIKWLLDKAQQNKFRLFLDAYDELPDGAGERLASELASLGDGISILVSTRIDTRVERELGAHSDDHDLRLAPFDNRYVTKYIERFFAADPKRRTDVRQRLRESPGPRELTRIPMLLAFYCRLLSGNDPLETLPTTRHQFLEQAFIWLFRQGDRRRHAKRNDAWHATKTTILTEAAWEFCGQQGQPIRFSSTEFLAVVERLSRSKRIRLPKRITAREVLEQLWSDQDGIFVRRGDGQIGFLLRSFHDYLVGQWIAEHCGEATAFPPVLAEKMGITANYTPLHHAGWANAWGYLAAQVEKDCLLELLIPSTTLRNGSNQEKHLIPCVRYSAQGNWRNRCREEIIDRLNREEQYDLEQEESAWALGEIGDINCFVELVSWLRNTKRAGSVRTACATALGRIGDDISRDELIIHLRDTNDFGTDMRMASANALAKIGDETSRAALIAKLRDAGEPNKRLRMSCPHALAEIGDEICRDELLTRLRDVHNTSEGIRECCARALGRIGDEVCHEELITRLRDVKGTDEGIRQHCAWALGEIGDEVCRNELVARLCDPTDPSVLTRVACADGLGHIRDEISRDQLIATIRDVNDTPNIVRVSCVQALGNISDELCRDALIGWLRDAKSTAHEVREHCAQVIGQIGGGVGRDALIAKMRDVDDPSESVRASCAHALARIGDTITRAAVRDCSVDSTTSDEVRDACKWALRDL